MKKKNLTIALTALLMLSGVANVNAQEPAATTAPAQEPAESTAPAKMSIKTWIFKTPTIVGFGGDIIHDNFKENKIKKFMNYDYYPAKFTAEKVLKKGWSMQGAFISTSLKPHQYFALDLGFKYDFNNLIGDTKWFDPYSILGLGFNYRSPFPANSIDRSINFNAGLGANLWLYPSWGVNMQGIAKLGHDSFLQASMGLVFKIGGGTCNNKCELTPKTKEAEDALQHLRGIINK